MIKILIFGTGGLAHFLTQHLACNQAEILAYVDRVSQIIPPPGINSEQVPTISPEEINSYAYDYIVIAFSNVSKGFEILKEQGVPKEKIVAYSFYGGFPYKDNYWQKKVNAWMHQEFNDNLIRDIFTIPPKTNYLCSMNIVQDGHIIEKDFVREQTLGLIAKEIRRRALGGNVAELGVFRGEFSKKINYLFPEKTLYLFDTFEGFDPKDIKSDCSLSLGEKLDNFNHTTVESVLEQMPYRNKCVVKRGFFPDTFDLPEEEFAFVSIDADLYAPIKSGLEIFYPRLQKGGYIMVHDYNNIVYKGAAKAVREWCDGRHISYVPIPDISGTVVLTK